MSEIKKQWCGTCGAWSEHGTWQHDGEACGAADRPVTAIVADLRREAEVNRLCGEAASAIERLGLERDCALARLEECHKIRDALIRSVGGQ